MFRVLRKNKAIPHFFALIAFITINSIYFYPQLTGYSLYQKDNINALGISKESRDYREEFKEEPLWTNSLFSGMPAYQVSFNNSNLINSLKGFLFRLFPLPIGYILLLMLGYYIFLLCLKVNPWLSIIGAIAFGLSSFNFIYLEAGHNAKVHAIAYVAPILGLIIFSYRNNLLVGSVLLSIFTCWHITANYLQITYYLLILILAICIVEFIIHLKNGSLRRFIYRTFVLLFSGLLGILPAVTNLLITNEYVKSSTRGKSELTIKPGTKTHTQGYTDALDLDYIKKFI
jgi:hypothetical protein